MPSLSIVSTTLYRDSLPKDPHHQTEPLLLVNLLQLKRNNFITRLAIRITLILKVMKRFDVKCAFWWEDRLYYIFRKPAR
jgi:hypothetical protein